MSKLIFDLIIKKGKEELIKSVFPILGNHSRILFVGIEHAN